MQRKSKKLLNEVGLEEIAKGLKFIPTNYQVDKDKEL